MSNTKTKLLEVIKGIQENRIMEVFEKYYHDDVIMYEKRDSTNRVGKEANRISEQVFADNVIIKEAKILKLLVDGNNSAYQMFMDFSSCSKWILDFFKTFIYFWCDVYFKDIFKANSYVCESNYYTPIDQGVLSKNQYTHIIEGVLGNKFVGFPPKEQPHITINAFYSPMPMDGVDQFSFNITDMGELKKGLGYYLFTGRALFPFTIGLFQGPYINSLSGSQIYNINLLTFTNDYEKRVPYFDKDFFKQDKGLTTTINIIPQVDPKNLNEFRNAIFSYAKDMECYSPQPPECPYSNFPKRIKNKNTRCLNYVTPNANDNGCFPVSLDFCSAPPKCTQGYDLIPFFNNGSLCPTYLCDFSNKYSFY
ncbi:hypothetical protein DICPUDRAFT_158609 [Dictyostelium purpureum]|uniref:Uncharacterized protein n=1 Tax=Dictyostelium purpureum TaxID=5786 RepID=F1A217_DICPU|nr:uncharacterized protein DICPUDRAFT_158609 [Dictyostelium purpureum]EGC29766.1 hypothetical protein DICPUDRAFT_158609 [Dictyostelium purpureum]|eukprot:XP_003293712.1 hypothetical protein DICPUDRAFT_158609 [Dictyostelium purpureum]